MPGQTDQNAPPTNPWLIAVTVSLATFMEVMDTSIANVALRYIAGSLAADQSESTWVLTSYLVSNAIVVPISGWLSTVIGRKRFYMMCVGLFTLSSFACGLAPTLPILLICRIVQGIGGGGLAPSEQAILADTFPQEKRGLAFALYGVAVVVAPAIGPALGGWITDRFSWRWIFFINVPVGLLSLALTSVLLRDSDSAKKEHEEATKGKIKVDFTGFAFVAIGLGCLQVVLDKGQEDDWFGSRFITTFALLSFIGIVGAIIWETLIAKEPIVDLRLYKDRGFFFTTIMMFAVFFVLLTTTQLLPQFVQQILPYNATKAGLTLMPGGFTVMALMPVAGWSVRKFQPKYIIAFGFVLVALSMWHLTDFEPGVSFTAVSMARVYQAAGISFLFVPINTLAYVDLPEGKSSHASALINLMRNLGGSVGISVGATMLARRGQLHQDRLVSHLTPTAHAFQQNWQALSDRWTAGGIDPVTAHHRALAAIYGNVQIQSAMLSYLDVFKVLMWGSLLAAALTLFLKRIDLSKKSHAGH